MPQKFRSEFLRTMHARGYVHQCSGLEALDAAAAGQLTGYIGFDCTAPSLHVGNLLPIMMLRRLQQAGHRPLVVIGGGTSGVGDPSGTGKTRKLLTDADIRRHAATIAGVFARFLAFDGPDATAAIIVDNREWLDDLRYIAFLRDYGRHFSIGRMLTLDSVRSRLDRRQPLSFLEFNYTIVQAYDFLELHRRYGCTLQMGGADQWGNIISGIELVRRVDGAGVHALTTALLTTAAGAKMGKTAAGAVWLNDDMLPAWEYWQFWRNVDDADAGRCLRLFTDLPLDEIARLEALRGAEAAEAKIMLATEATALAHGRKAADEARATARATFGAERKAERSSPAAHGGAGSLPTVTIAAAELEAGLGLLSACVRAGLAASNGEARRGVRARAVRVNDATRTDETTRLTTADLHNGVIKLSVGKKRHALLALVPPSL